MSAARPSKAQLENAIAAMKSAGFAVGEIIVNADGSFRVLTAVDKPAETAGKAKQWPKAAG